MTTQSEALRLADELDEMDAQFSRNGLCGDGAAELRRLHAEAEESDALRERLAALLKATAIALRGPEPELTSWGWADLPERVAAIVAEVETLHQRHHDDNKEYTRVLAENESLRSALEKTVREFAKHGRHHWPEAVIARAALAAKENT